MAKQNTKTEIKRKLLAGRRCSDPRHRPDFSAFMCLWVFLVCIYTSFKARVHSVHHRVIQSQQASPDTEKQTFFFFFFCQRPHGIAQIEIFLQNRLITQLDSITADKDIRTITALFLFLRLKNQTRLFCVRKWRYFTRLAPGPLFFWCEPYNTRQNTNINRHKSFSLCNSFVLIGLFCAPDVLPTVSQTRPSRISPMCTR